MCRVTEHKKFLIKLKSCFWILFSAQKSIEKSKFNFKHFFIAPRRQAQRDNLEFHSINHNLQEHFTYSKNKARFFEIAIAYKSIRISQFILYLRIR